MNSQITTLAIGKFDAIHLGHQKIFQQLLKNNGILIINKQAQNLIVPRRFLPRFVNFPIFYYQFSEIQNLIGLEFLQLLKKDFPNLKKIIVGYDFYFGKNRQWNSEFIKNSNLFQVEIIDEVRIDNVSIHSSKITELLQNGNIQIVNKLLGREFSIIGKHIEGQKLGRKKLVPTINIHFENYITPKNGVYLTKTVIQNREFNSISFLGIRQTTDNQFSLETYILNHSLEFKNFGEIETKFIKFLRENIKFNSIAFLKKAIQNDISQAKSYFENPISKETL